MPDEYFKFICVFLLMERFDADGSKIEKDVSCVDGLEAIAQFISTQGILKLLFIALKGIIDHIYVMRLNSRVNYLLN